MQPNKKLSLEEIKDIHEKFVLLSPDKGRSIKQEDAMDLLRAIGLNPSQRELDRAIDVLNYEKSSSLTQDQFQKIAAHVWREDSTEEQLARAFKAFDTNHDGTVDVREFREAMMKHGEPMTYEEFNHFISLIDNDHNGRISYTGKRSS